MTFRDYSCEVLAWVDIESTGLDPHEDSMLEFAMVITTPDLEPVGEPTNVLVKPRAGWEDRMDGIVREMHTTNGLLEDHKYAFAAWSVSALDAALNGQFEMLGLHRGHVWLAGSGVNHFDRLVIDAQMPKVAEWFPYFNFDTGNLRRATSLWEPSLVLSGHGMADKPHRALADLQLHLAEAQNFRNILKFAADYPT